LQNGIKILAIETSCDDTSAAVLQDRKVLSNVVSSQEIHRFHGGVVPELAGRDHLRYILPVVKEALARSGISGKELSAIGVTRGPGLPGSLQVGMNVAKSLAMAWNKPLIGVHHIRAHILSVFIEKEGHTRPEFPFLALVVSGGHTQLMLVKSPYDFQLIGKTRDDAVGEAFDKAAKLMGLPYPGGPVIDKLSENGDENKYSFSPYHGTGLDYSFSGIKTSFLYFLKKQQASDKEFLQKEIHHVCASYQKHLVMELIKVVRRAVEQFPVRHIVVTGGVSVNRRLRKEFQCWQEQDFQIHFPLPEFCTDNAAMIGITAWFDYSLKKYEDWNCSILSRWNELC